MSEDAPAAYVLAIAILFARIGGVFLVAPGLSNVRAPVKVRLFIALGVTLALSTQFVGLAASAVVGRSPAELLALLGGETLIGLLIGLLVRFLMMALQTMSVAIANMVGLGGIPGIALDGNEPSQAAASLFTMTAITIIFITDLHHDMIRAAAGSYSVLAPGAALDLEAAMNDIMENIHHAFMVGLRLAAPFIIYSVIVNFAVGLTNKLTPQLPVFFVALPAVAAGGLIMMAYAIREVMFAFQQAYAQILSNL